MIRFEHVAKHFGNQNVLRDVSYCVPRGLVSFVLGRSGAGKSVLSKLVVGLLYSDSGSVFFDNVLINTLSEQHLHDVRMRCQYIFQHATLFDSLTVLDNVALPIRKHRGLNVRASRLLAEEQLAHLHVDDIAQQMPETLGPGQRKRVAIARAMAMQPDCLLLDEPTTGLDPVAARRVDALIREVSIREGITCMVVSHDLVSVRSIADNVAFLHEGSIAFQGKVEEFFASTTPCVRRFCGGDHTHGNR